MHAPPSDALWALVGRPPPGKQQLESSRPVPRISGIRERHALRERAAAVISVKSRARRGLGVPQQLAEHFGLGRPSVLHLPSPASSTGAGPVPTALPAAAHMSRPLGPAAPREPSRSPETTIRTPGSPCPAQAAGLATGRGTLPAPGEGILKSIPIQELAHHRSDSRSGVEAASGTAAATAAAAAAGRDVESASRRTQQPHPRHLPGGDGLPTTPPLRGAGSALCRCHTVARDSAGLVESLLAGCCRNLPRRRVPAVPRPGCECAAATALAWSGTPGLCRSMGWADSLERRFRCCQHARFMSASLRETHVGYISPCCQPASGAAMATRPVPVNTAGRWLSHRIQCTRSKSSLRRLGVGIAADLKLLRTMGLAQLLVAVAFALPSMLLESSRPSQCPSPSSEGFRGLCDAPAVRLVLNHSTGCGQAAWQAGIGWLAAANRVTNAVGIPTPWPCPVLQVDAAGVALPRQGAASAAMAMGAVLCVATSLVLGVVARGEAWATRARESELEAEPRGGEQSCCFPPRPHARTLEGRRERGEVWEYAVMVWGFPPGSPLEEIKRHMEFATRAAVSGVSLALAGESANLAVLGGRRVRQQRRAASVRRRQQFLAAVRAGECPGIRLDDRWEWHKRADARLHQLLELYQGAADRSGAEAAALNLQLRADMTVLAGSRSLGSAGGSVASEEEAVSRSGAPAPPPSAPAIASSTWRAATCGRCEPRCACAAVLERLGFPEEPGAVVVTFDSIEGRARALELFPRATALFPSMTCRTPPLAQQFRGKHVLLVQAAPSPRAILWGNVAWLTLRARKRCLGSCRLAVSAAASSLLRIVLAAAALAPWLAWLANPTAGSLPADTAAGGAMRLGCWSPGASAPARLCEDACGLAQQLGPTGFELLAGVAGFEHASAVQAACVEVQAWAGAAQAAPWVAGALAGALTPLVSRCSVGRARLWLRSAALASGACQAATLAALATAVVPILLGPAWLDAFRMSDPPLDAAAQEAWASVGAGVPGTLWAPAVAAALSMAATHHFAHFAALVFCPTAAGHMTAPELAARDAALSPRAEQFASALVLDEERACSSCLGPPEPLVPAASTWGATGSNVISLLHLRLAVAAAQTTAGLAWGPIQPAVAAIGGVSTLVAIAVDLPWLLCEAAAQAERYGGSSPEDEVDHSAKPAEVAPLLPSSATATRAPPVAAPASARLRGVVGSLPAHLLSEWSSFSAGSAILRWMQAALVVAVALSTLTALATGTGGAMLLASSPVEETDTHSMLRQHTVLLVLAALLAFGGALALLGWHVCADACIVQERWAARASLGTGPLPVLGPVSRRLVPSGTSSVRLQHALATGLIQGSCTYQPWEEPEFQLQG